VGKDELTLRSEAQVQPGSTVPMSAERYIATEALRQAICGREAEVLRALGIEWKKGVHHISCPYPDHADQNPSWRWDERKARAFCTCITTPCRPVRPQGWQVAMLCAEQGALRLGV
jgi:hypothetical protein